MKDNPMELVETLQSAALKSVKYQTAYRELDWILNSYLPDLELFVARRIPLDVLADMPADAKQVVQRVLGLNLDRNWLIELEVARE